MNCCDKVRELARVNRRQQAMIINLKRELKGEKQLRKKAESYYKELEAFLEQEGETNGKKK
jgi:hypothetical protein